MEVRAYSHIVTPTEIAAMRLLGFLVTGDPGQEHNVINKHFPNLDLFKLIRDIDETLTPLCSGSIINKEIIFSDAAGPFIGIRFCTDNFWDSEVGLGLMRTFFYENDEIIVGHNLFRIPREYRSRGVARVIFRALLQQYLNANVSKIRVYAALVDGGYVWGRHFFTADNRGEVDIILATAEKKLAIAQFRAVKRIYDNYYVKDAAGKAFPIYKWAYLPFMEEVLRGAEWQGTMDLKNAEQFSNFIKYVIR